MRKWKRKMNLFYIPAMFLISFFVLRPFVETVYISLCKWNGYSQTKSFIGFQNYVKMFTDAKLINAFKNTVFYGVGSTVLQNVIGLSIALFVNSRFRGNQVVRVVVYMPIMISGLIMGYIMYFFLTYDRGVLNELIGFFGIQPIDWLADGNRGTWIITIINSWQYAGVSFIIYLSGLQNVPKMYTEAAAIDGAGKFQQFRYITFPLLLPAVTSAVIINLIGGLKIYDVVVSLTNGGPNFATHSLMSYLNAQYFLSEKAGYASAIGISTFVLIMIVSLVLNSYFERKQVDM